MATSRTLRALLFAVPLVPLVAAAVSGKGHLSTHVLDLSSGRPVAGMPVAVHRAADANGTQWTLLSSNVTNSDGRVPDALAGRPLQTGVYKLAFDTSLYCAGRDCFFKDSQLVFEVRDPDQKYHVPLLLTPYSYTTYRGS